VPVVSSNGAHPVEEPAAVPTAPPEQAEPKAKTVKTKGKIKTANHKPRARGKKKK